VPNLTSPHFVPGRQSGIVVHTEDDNSGLIRLKEGALTGLEVPFQLAEKEIALKKREHVECDLACNQMGIEAINIEARPSRHGGVILNMNKNTIKRLLNPPIKRILRFRV
jgi:hypothetical protein